MVHLRKHTRPIYCNIVSDAVRAVLARNTPRPRTCGWRSGSAPPVYTLYRALLPTIQLSEGLTSSFLPSDRLLGEGTGHGRVRRGRIWPSHLHILSRGLVSVTSIGD